MFNFSGREQEERLQMGCVWEEDTLRAETFASKKLSRFSRFFFCENAKVFSRKNQEISKTRKFFHAKTKNFSKTQNSTRLKWENSMLRRWNWFWVGAWWLMKVFSANYVPKTSKRESFCKKNSVFWHAKVSSLKVTSISIFLKLLPLIAVD